MIHRFLALAVVLVALAATQGAAHAATQRSTQCHVVGGKIVHRRGEHCIVLRHPRLVLLTVPDRH